jgi:hypothetical protein
LHQSIDTPDSYALVLFGCTSRVVFSKSILEFFPKEDVHTERDEKIDALLRTAKQLNDEDVEELRRFAEFRRAQHVYTKRTPGRKAKK